MRTLLLVLPCALLGATFAEGAAHALEGFPATVKLPPQVTTKSLSSMSYDQAEVLVGEQARVVQGRVVSAWLDLHYGDKRPTAAATWQAWRPGLEGAGWKLVGERGDELHSLSRPGEGGETFLEVELGDFAEPKLTLVERGTKPRRLEFPPPAPNKVEAVPADRDWPYLPALPGAKLNATVEDANVPLLVQLPGASEVTMVSARSMRKEYAPPPGLSRLEMVLSVGDALERAGWQVLSSRDPAHLDKVLVAHFHKSGRDIWATVDGSSDAGISLVYTVADLGAEDWRRELEQKCRLTLAGVTFDFDKATLRPDSASALEKAAAALKALPSLAVEVQGHTDNVGDDAYNVTLSNQRAQTVLQWLSAHGVPAARLSAKGYGKSVPVASNDTDEGRARNRRVELTCRK